MHAPEEAELRLQTMQMLLGARASDAAPANAVIRLAREWKVIPQLRGRLLKLDWTERERNEVRELARESFTHTVAAIRAGIRATELLEAAAIRCVTFKGLPALAELYPGPGHRTLQDVDILIGPRDLARALELLEFNGYTRSAGGALDEYIRFLRHSPGFAGNEAISLTDARGGAIDVHWKLGRIDTAGVFAGARRITVLHKNVPAASAAHSLLLVVHHSLRNDFIADRIARDVLDFDAWLGRLDASTEIPLILRTAGEWGLKIPALAMESIIARLRGTQAGRLAPHATAGERRAADDLAELYFHQIREGALNPDLVYLTDYRPLQQMVAGAAGGWKRYRTRMKEMEALNGSPDAPLVERLRRLAQSAGRFPARRWRQLRRLAAAKAGIA